MNIPNRNGIALQWLLLYLVQLLLPQNLSAQTVIGEKAGIPPAPKVFRTEPWEDPQVISINRDLSRATAYSL